MKPSLERKKAVQVLVSHLTSYVILGPQHFMDLIFLPLNMFNYVSLAALIIYYSIMNYQALISSDR